eukprot:5663334-Amphidinium_carterae.1
MRREERREEEDYWKNIVDIMYEYFYDDNEITAVRHLHEGVLYWMTEDIESLQKQALHREDTEAKKKYDFYLEENQ